MVSYDDYEDNSKKSCKRRKHPAVWACDRCPKRFTRLSSLTAHSNNHEGKRPFLCTVCGSSFTRNHDRRTHESTHTGVRRYFCSGKLTEGGVWGCGRAFNRLTNLERHFRSQRGRRCTHQLLDRECIAEEEATTDQEYIRSRLLSVLNEVEISAIGAQATSIERPSAPGPYSGRNIENQLVEFAPPTSTLEEEITAEVDIETPQRANQETPDDVGQVPRPLGPVQDLDPMPDPVSLPTNITTLQAFDPQIADETDFSALQLLALRCSWCNEQCQSDWELEEHSCYFKAQWIELCLVCNFEQLDQWQSTDKSDVYNLTESIEGQLTSHT